MFPLLEKEKPNPLELFQIWLNLPKEDKLVSPHFSMLWGKDIPKVAFTDDAGRATEVTVIAGALDDKRPPSPPPHSWASRPDTHIAIWTIKMTPKSRWTLPPTHDGDIIRTLYFFGGSTVDVDGELVRDHAALVIQSDKAVSLEAGDEPVDILMLQGRPIGQPVVQYGPFVMNTRDEIEQAIRDYQRTRFGGWPWPNDAPVHGRDEPRFANHADGRTERLDR
jgi:redox-sensitive bicupin YhaK (pirin superfamily)